MVLFWLILFAGLSIGCTYHSEKEFESSISLCIAENVTSMNVSHIIGGQVTQWTLEGKEVNSLQDWIIERNCRLVKFEKGQSPGDNDGGEVYDFSAPNGEFPDFSYIINGVKSSYFLIGGDWYFVSNPSVPPIKKHQEEVPTFSFEETVKTYQKGVPGVHYSGFKNVSELVLQDVQDVIDTAQKECTISYDSVKVFHDAVLEMWMVIFYTEKGIGNDQTVFLNQNGITCLIVYGE